MNRQNFFSVNLKFLRKRRARTQDDVALALKMKRSTLSGYENKVGQPNIESLLLFSDYYNISVDTLLKVDLTQLSESKLRELEAGYDTFIKGTKLRVLATTVDSDNNDQVEVVPVKAHAGYAGGYADPEFIGKLERFRLPFLPRDKKFRTFQVKGDSMLPIPEGAWVTGQFTDDWYSLKDGDACIILTLDDGIVFKIVENFIKEDRSLVLHSLNPAYKPYRIKVAAIQEIWKFANYICSELPLPEKPEASLQKSVENIRQNVEFIKMELMGRRTGVRMPNVNVRQMG